MFPLRAASCRLCAMIRTVSPLSLHTPAAPFSSMPTTTTTSAPTQTSSSYFDRDPEGVSSVYRHTLKFQRPTLIHWKRQLSNSASFIGIVEFTPRITASSSRFGVHTVLTVSSSTQSNRPIRILLMMWDNLAEISLKHLKPNDFIYVSGTFGSFEKSDADGNLRPYYKVIVSELNYVAAQTCAQGRPLQHPDKLESQEVVGTGSPERVEGTKEENRIHLWQIFFANPFEWWDNRKNKAHKSSPDFKHKDTGESLWLSPRDPPWIREQLHLLDSRIAPDQGMHRHISSHPRLSKWEYDE